MARARVASSLLVAWFAMSVAGPAHAYCRAKACDDEINYDDIWQEVPDPPLCVRDTNGCLIEGRPLYWPRTCMSFGVQRNGSVTDGIDYETAHAAISRAFETWLSADCGGKPPSFAVYDYGAVECGMQIYNPSRPNVNVFVFRDDEWPYDAGVNPIALTTTTYNIENGKIYDADVELNSFDNVFVVDDPGSLDTDLESILVHEVGHFLGLSHSDVREATMWKTYDRGTISQRDLHPDDVEGICAVFPPEWPVDTSHCEPRWGFASECSPPADDGCGVVRRARGARGELLLIGLCFALFGGRRVRAELRARARSRSGRSG